MSRLKRLRGIKAAVHDAVDFTADLVAKGNASGWGHAARITGAIAGPEPKALVETIHAISIPPALAVVRGVNRLVERLTDAGLDAATAASLLDRHAKPSVPIATRSDVVGTGPWLADAAIGAINGAVGDYLHRGENALALGMSLRRDDAYLTTPLAAGARIAVFVHGLGVTEWSWWMKPGVDPADPTASFGTLLEKDAGFAPVYVRYNTGRRIAENGELLASLLEELAAGAAEIVLVGHSMGGLVARSACEKADDAGHEWVKRVSRVVTLGTPHHGAPLERAGVTLTSVLSAIDLPGTLIPGEILGRRSAGVRDLRHGVVTRELAHVAYFSASATVTRDTTNPVGAVVGDLLVPVTSATGTAPRTRAFGSVLHHELQVHPEVYAWLREVCTREP
jgi:pimeloyl-ACP methyl ester carboxylesterase